MSTFTGKNQGGSQDWILGEANGIRIINSEGYSVILSVCPSVCLLPCFLLLRATRKSDTNGFRATLFKNGDFGRVYLHSLPVLNTGVLVVCVGVKPDIVTVGKPMGNGHPVAAVVTTKEIAKDFLAKRPDLQNEVRLHYMYVHYTVETSHNLTVETSHRKTLRSLLTHKSAIVYYTSTNH